MVFLQQSDALLLAGSDVYSLHNHLSKLDPTVDIAFFALVYTHLCRHPSVQIALAAHPLPGLDGITIPGDAALPPDYIAPDVTLTTADPRAPSGEYFKGRAMVSHLAGKEYRTESEAKQDQRDARRRKKADRRENAKPKEGMRELIRIIGEDDGDEDGDKVKTTDLERLKEKWGSRLRIRCTDNEIYFRLTGSHYRVGAPTRS